MDNRTSSKSPIKQSERRKATVMFADISGFTAMSEKLDAEEVTSVMNECFEILVDKVKKYNGTVDKFIGDCIMSLYGLPSAIENAPMKAVNSAIEMRESLYKFNKEKGLKIPLDIHIGITTGEVISGEVGASDKKEYTVMGDSVNLASRLEDSSTKGQILVCPETYNLTKNDFEYNKLPPIALKGKEKPVAVYELLSRQEKMYRAKLGYERIIQSEMVGRDKELNIVELELNKLIDKKGSIIAIIGEAGIGKSRLLAELREKDIVKKATLLEGRAISIGKTLSFHPIIDLLKSWAVITENDSEEESYLKLEKAIKKSAPNDLKEIFPFTATMMGMKLKGEYAERVKGIEGDPLFKLILKSMKDLLVNICQEKPILIILEDLHWADTSSIELLESVFRLSEKNPIMFVNLLRPGHEYTCERIIKYLKENHADYYIEINLQTLDKAQSATLVGNLIKIKGMPENIREQIIERSGGNPFFIEEVIRSFIDTGVIKSIKGIFELTDGIDSVVIPYTINEVIMSRIDRLDDETKNLLRMASVIGRNFFYRILISVARDLTEIDKRIGYLKGIQLIIERKRVEEIEYLFKHALAQTAIYESILIKTRKKLHLSVALAFEQEFTEKISEVFGMLAFHYCQAEELDKAEEYLIKAGEASMESSASSEALVYYKKALDLYVNKFGHKVDNKKMAMFHKNIGNAYYNKGQYQEANEHCERALAYLGYKIPKNKLFIYFKALLGFLNLLKIVYLPSYKKKLKSSSIIKEFYHITVIKQASLVMINPEQLFIESLISILFYAKYDPKEITKGAEYFYGAIGGMLGYLGFYKLNKKIIDYIKGFIKKDSLKYLFIDKVGLMNTDYYTGVWNKGYKEEIHNCLYFDFSSIQDITYYCTYCGHIDTEKGYFKEVEKIINKLEEMAELYDNDDIRICYYELMARYNFKKRALEDVLEYIDKGMNLSLKTGQITMVIYFLGLQAEVLLLSNKVADAKDALDKAKRYIKQSGIVPVQFFIQYCVARVWFDLYNLENSLQLNKRTQISSLKSKALKSCKKAVKVSKKFAADRTEALRLMGTYSWLCGKQREALKWWENSIRAGKRFGARLELSRTYFEVGKRLSIEKSSYKQLNNIPAKEYLNKAKVLFKDIELERDLKELEKVQSHIQQQQSSIQK